MMDDEPKSKPLVLDPGAKSASDKLPAFLARPADAPVYHGFPVIAESATDGWYLGTITDFADPNGCDYGDAYVVAPDGSRAGLVWQVGKGATEQICPPEEGRWGVYAIWFANAIRTTEDFVAAFRRVLPELQAIHARVKKGKPKRQVP
jgi:hypothetical protein